MSAELEHAVAAVLTALAKLIDAATGLVNDIAAEERK